MIYRSTFRKLSKMMSDVKAKYNDDLNTDRKDILLDVQERMESIFKEDNPNFDSLKWQEACKPRY